MSSTWSGRFLADDVAELVYVLKPLITNVLLPEIHFVVHGPDALLDAPMLQISRDFEMEGLDWTDFQAALAKLELGFQNLRMYCLSYQNQQCLEMLQPIEEAFEEMAENEVINEPFTPKQALLKLKRPIQKLVKKSRADFLKKSKIPSHKAWHLSNYLDVTDPDFVPVQLPRPPPPPRPSSAPEQTRVDISVGSEASTLTNEQDLVGSSAG